MELNDSSDGIAYLSQVLPSIATQLRAALGNLHFASSALAPAEERERNHELDMKAAVLDQSYYQLLRVINNLSAAADLQNQDPLPAKDLDLVDLVRNSCDCCTSLADLLGIRFQFVCIQPQHICAVYRESMELLLSQLLSNAFKFTPKGGSVTVELKFADGRVFLSVDDSGCGISDELLPSLFDRYLHKDLMNPPPHGLGLGLSLCRRIAEGHGGNMMAESKLGIGTRITLCIPDRQTGVSAVSDVAFDYAGGFNHTLLALSDALPVSAFMLREME